MGTVRSVYMVSAGRSERKDYRDAIAYAMADVRWWYKRQLGGTFTLAGPVEVVHSTKSGEWFGSHQARQHGDDTYYFNVLHEAQRLLGTRRDDPRWRWVIYCDAPGNKGRGGNGVCIMPEDDLLGLIGRHPTERRQERWRGGLAHELGHALGLEHPDTYQKTATYNKALMMYGYALYPSTYLTPVDKKILGRSPFIYGMKRRLVPTAGARGVITGTGLSGMARASAGGRLGGRQ